MKILIIGLTAGGAEVLPASLQTRIHQADLLVGGRRQLAYFPEFQGETLTIVGITMAQIASRLQQARKAKQQAVVLASGDPFCYGIATSLRRYLSAEAFEVIPAPSSFQLAFAALGESWHEAALLTAHGRPLESVIHGVLTHPKAAILTDNQNKPAILAKAFMTAGLAGETRCAICENLGGPAARVIRTTLAEVDTIDHSPLNVFVVWSSRTQNHPIAPGLADEAFSTNRGQITKREIRLLTLAELALQPGEVMWDIGAGSGSVSIEAARLQPSAQVYAIEKRPEMISHLQENLTRFPAPNLQWHLGIAPAEIVEWPDPHAIFIGGSGGQLPTLLKLLPERLRAGGRLVINLATLDHIQTVQAMLPNSSICQVQINRGVPIQTLQRLQALNPIFMIRWRK